MVVARAAATAGAAGLTRPVGTARSWLRTMAAEMTAETSAAAALWRPSGMRRFPFRPRTWVTAVVATEKTK